jgi:predicted dehydrogenase
LKTAILGTGRMGRRHIQVVRALGLDLVGICDSNPEALALASEESGVSLDLNFDDSAILFEQTQPECVVIATTAPTHCEFTCLAAETGASHILVEKPMATSLADCDRMLQACARHGARLSVNHQMRFMEQYTEPKSIVQSEAFGGLCSITVVAGNFGMAMNGTHYFEMFRYMTEESPDEVTAWFSPGKVPNPRGQQFEDRAGAIRITTKSGKRFYMEVSADQGHGIKVIYGGPYGQLLVDELAGKMELVVREEGYRNLPSTRYGMPAVSRNFSIEPADVIAPSKAVLNALINGNNFPSGEDAKMAFSALVAAYVSNESGHLPVKVDVESLPVDRTFPWA